MEQLSANISAVGGLAGIAAILSVLVLYFKSKKENSLAVLQMQIQSLQAASELQLKTLAESVNSWKGLWEASTQEIRELKMEIKELRTEIDKLKTEIDKLRTENAELKGQLKEHYKLA